jgi:hypothetical protein
VSDVGDVVFAILRAPTARTRRIFEIAGLIEIFGLQNGSGRGGFGSIDQ